MTRGRKHDNPLVARAAEAMQTAYAPYSGFRVGAALAAADGTVYTGGNVENASYGLTLCAERVAVARAVSDGQRRFSGLAIVASGRETPYPCGACRQVLAEFCGPEFEIAVAPAVAHRRVKTLKLKALLPKTFRLRPPSRPRRKGPAR
jgi:cytidine deaminase